MLPNILVFRQENVFLRREDPVGRSCIACVHAPEGPRKRACLIHVASPEQSLRAIPIGARPLRPACAMPVSAQRETGHQLPWYALHKDISPMHHAAC